MFIFCISSLLKSDQQHTQQAAQKQADAPVDHTSIETTISSQHRSQASITQAQQTEERDAKVKVAQKAPAGQTTSNKDSANKRQATTTQNVQGSNKCSSSTTSKFAKPTRKAQHVKRVAEAQEQNIVYKQHRRSSRVDSGCSGDSRGIRLPFMKNLLIFNRQQTWKVLVIKAFYDCMQTSRTQ